MDVLTNFIVVTISQCICIPNYHVILLKLTQFFLSILISIKLEKKVTYVIQMYKEKIK